MTRQAILLLLLLSLNLICFSQENKLIFEWGAPFLTNISNEQRTDYQFFLKNGFNNPDQNDIPTLSHLIRIEGNASTVKTTINSYTATELTELEKKITIDLSSLSSSPQASSSIVTINGKKHILIQIEGLLSINNVVNKVTSVTFNYQISNNSTKKTKQVSSNLTSVNFYEGKWFKFGITATGAHKITYEDLIDNNIISSPISSSSINLYGSEGKMPPFIIGEAKPNNLSAMNIELIDNNDGSFNPGDYILFYAEKASNSYYENSTNKLLHNNNYYSDTNFIFLNTDDKNPKRITKTTASNNPTVADVSFSDVLYHHEKDYLNFIKSGRIWVGEDFQNENPITFTIPTKHVKTENIWLKVKACARSFTAYKNQISIIVNGDTVSKLQFPIVSTIYHNDYVKFREVEVNLTSNTDVTEIQVYYHRPEPGALAWLDYFTLNYQQPNQLEEHALLLQNKNTKLNPDHYNFNFSSQNDQVKTWDITNYQEVKEIVLTKSNSDYSFKANTTLSDKFLAFLPNHVTKAQFISTVNPHTLNDKVTPQYLIISPSKFIQEANRLADFHRTHSNLKTLVVNAEHIYNIYSSGRKEAPAIRNYIKFLYDNTQGTDSLKYVLLFGSGSYDPKNRIPGNLDLIPTYQSENSIKLTASYVTDDFYGVMDQQEGDFLNNDQLDIAVGRLPVRTNSDAATAVDKIFQYMGIFEQKKDNGENYSNQGPWRNNILFVADDGDVNEHMKQAENIATMVDTAIPNLNIDKVYIDAFLKEVSASGTTTNSAKDNIVRNLENGALIINYTGHGGEYGWASERILDVNTILKLNNRENLPLVMTATCEFSRFDDPQRVSAGEYLFLQKNGGAIALFTTVRLVFSIPNFNLNKQLYNVLKESKNDETIRIGDVFRRTKLKNNAGTNDRNFTLLGDPALPLAFPKRSLRIDSIVLWDKTKTDTLKALSQAKIFGRAVKGNNTLTNFNGELEIKIFDKKITNTTLDNSGTGNAFKFTSQNSILYRGMVTVKNGVFTSEIIIPKNTLSNYEKAKISLYASSTSSAIDAAGNDKSYTIGGLDSLAPRDEIGPEIKVYINDSNFTFGDRVTPDPYFIAELKDESGINVTSNNIQNNMVLTIDQSAEFQYILNNQYQTNNDTYKSGNVSVQLNDLKNGNHSLEFTASDNHNNKNTHYTEFIIQENAKLALEHVLNYPNPFTTNTGFYFEQNQLNANIEVLIQVYTITGKIIKTILTSFDANQKRIGPINWDGKDDFGDAIGRGVYLYKIKVLAENGTSAEQIEKLVILK